MPKPRDILRDVTFFADGTSYAGVVTQVTLPTLEQQTEEFRAGAMNGQKEVEMGLSAMRLGVQFNAVPAGIYKLFGKENIEYKTRGWLKSPGSDDKGCVATLRGRIISDNPGNWQPGSVATKEVTIACDAYAMSIDGETVHDVDNDKYQMIVDGVDLLEQARGFLGIG